MAQRHLHVTRLKQYNPTAIFCSIVRRLPHTKKSKRPIIDSKINRSIVINRVMHSTNFLIRVWIGAMLSEKWSARVNIPFTYVPVLQTSWWWTVLFRTFFMVGWTLPRSPAVYFHILLRAATKHASYLFFYQPAVLCGIWILAMKRVNFTSSLSLASKGSSFGKLHGQVFVSARFLSSSTSSPAADHHIREAFHKLPCDGYVLAEYVWIGTALKKRFFIIDFRKSSRWHGTRSAL